MPEIEWKSSLVSQMSFAWEYMFVPRMQGLTDDEYLWAPVADVWSVHPGEPPTVDPQRHVEPAPFTTIAWRLGHVIVGVLAARNAAHFGAPAASYESWTYAGDAETAFDQLESQLGIWLDGVRGLGNAALAEPVGPKEPYPDAPMADLVLHIHRELIHHLSEVCLLRDLFLHTHATNGESR